MCLVLAACAETAEQDLRSGRSQLDQKEVNTVGTSNPVFVENLMRWDYSKDIDFSDTYIIQEKIY
jgi:hypothetical protein